MEELTLEDSILGDIPVIQDIPIDLPPEGTAGWLGFGWFLAALILIMIGGSMLIPAIKSMLIRDRTYYGESGVLAISNILYKSAFIIGTLLLGFVFWKYGFTAPFLILGLTLGIFLVIAIILLDSGSVEKE